MQKMGIAIILIILGLIVLAFPVLGVVPAAVITGFLVLLFGLGMLFGGLFEISESVSLGILEIILGIIASDSWNRLYLQPGSFCFLSRINYLHCRYILCNSRYNRCNHKGWK